MKFFMLLLSFPALCLGHGGPRTAEYLKNNLFNNLCSHPDFIKDTKSAIGIRLFKIFFLDFLCSSFTHFYGDHL